MFERIRNKILTIENLHKIRTQNQHKKIVFCTGCYDILQSGHAVFFNQCKSLGDLLIVGVGADKVIEELKGPGRPVNPENNRLYLIAALHDVDYALLNEEKLYPGKIDFKNILKNLQPDIFVLNRDDSALKEKSALCDEVGTEIKFVERVVPPELEATSTTRIIDKINFKYRAPLRIDLAGGWSDVPFIMGDKTGCVSNLAIKPLIEYKNGQFNFSGYPRGSGLSTSTAVKLLELMSSKTYNSDSKSLTQIAEDLFTLENTELNWAIGRQDQYSIVFGGFNCFEFDANSGKKTDTDLPKDIIDKFASKILIIHTGVSRNAQSAVEDVYNNYKSPEGAKALAEIAQLGKDFYEELKNENFSNCATIISRNFEAQKKLAPATSNEKLDEIYDFALQNGAQGGKIAGAGGGGAFIFITDNREELTAKLKKEFVDCFEIDFQVHYKNVKESNRI